jgi:hypothetical protein
MSARRTAAAIAVVIALGFLVVAALTPLRADRVAELDARAYELGQQWAQDQGNDALAQESNEFFDRARALEAPLAPTTALGAALLALAVGSALRPGRGATEDVADVAEGPDGSRVDVVAEDATGG